MVRGKTGYMITRKMSRFEEDLARGYLETGEPLEALYGTGWWTQQPEPEAEVIPCPRCGQPAYALGNEIYCDNCPPYLECQDCSDFDLCSNLGYPDEEDRKEVCGIEEDDVRKSAHGLAP